MADEDMGTAAVAWEDVHEDAVPEVDVADDEFDDSEEGVADDVPVLSVFGSERLGMVE